MSEEKNRPQARSRRHSFAARGNEGESGVIHPPYRTVQQACDLERQRRDYQEQRLANRTLGLPPQIPLPDC